MLFYGFIQLSTGQNIWRKIQEERLAALYTSDESFCMEMRKILALSFIRPDKMDDALGLVTDTMPAEGLPVLAYFEENYIGRGLRARRLPARQFDISVWNNHERVVENLPRSNNYSEAFNNSFAEACERQHHLRFDRFVEKLHGKQNDAELDIAQMLSGAAPKQRRLKYRKVDDNIRRLVLQFDSIREPTLQDLQDHLDRLVFNVGY